MAKTQKIEPDGAQTHPASSEMGISAPKMPILPASRFVKNADEADLKELSEDQRMFLVCDTNETSLVGEDEGLEEVKRRSKEMDDDPGVGMTWEELKASLSR